MFANFLHLFNIRPVCRKHPSWYKNFVMVVYYCNPDSTNGRKQSISRIDATYYVDCNAAAVIGKTNGQIKFFWLLLLIFQRKYCSHTISYTFIYFYSLMMYTMMWYCRKLKISKLCSRKFVLSVYLLSNRW